MNTPYLVQRLQKPYKIENPFSFGGGLPRGGITKEAYALIRQVMDFDYMGSAEFEWGAVPTALQVLNDAPELAVIEISVLQGENRTIWGICLPQDKEDVIEWIKLALKRKNPHTKERLGLVEAINGEKYARTVGWLKIEDSERCKSPFMFFIDEEMFTNTLKLFNYK